MVNALECILSENTLPAYIINKYVAETYTVEIWLKGKFTFRHIENDSFLMGLYMHCWKKALKSVSKCQQAVIKSIYVHAR